MNPPTNTNASSISCAVGSQVTVEYCRTELVTTYPPQTSQSTPAASQSTPAASQNIPPPSLSICTCFHLPGFLPTLTVQKPNH